MSFKRKGRTLGITVDDLMESKRLEIALELYKQDPMLLKAILIELGNECLQVAKNTIIKNASTVWGLDKFEALPYLRSVTDFKTFNIHWQLSPIEQKYYYNKVSGNLSEEQSKKMFEQIKKNFGMEG